MSTNKSSDVIKRKESLETASDRVMGKETVKLLKILMKPTISCIVSGSVASGMTTSLKVNT